MSRQLKERLPRLRAGAPARFLTADKDPGVAKAKPRIDLFLSDWE